MLSAWLLQSLTPALGTGRLHSGLLLQNTQALLSASISALPRDTPTPRLGLGKHGIQSRGGQVRIHALGRAVLGQPPCNTLRSYLLAGFLPSLSHH